MLIKNPASESCRISVFRYSGRLVDLIFPVNVFADGLAPPRLCSSVNQCSLIFVLTRANIVVVVLLTVSGHIKHQIFLDMLV